MATYQGTWSLCGGWAVDAWVGQLTREHEDVDVVVFQDELGTLLEHLADWDLLAHDRNWDVPIAEQWDGRSLELPAHIHARSPEERGPLPEDGIAKTEEGFWLDIQINERDGSEWVLNSEPRIALALEHCIRVSPWGVPTLTPEALLFYKGGGTEIRRRDNADLRALLPALGDEQRRWLREAIALVGHPWLARLSA